MRGDVQSSKTTSLTDPMPLEQSIDDVSDVSGSVTIGLEVALVLANVFPVWVALSRPSGKCHVTDELIAALGVTDILSVLVPAPLGWTSYFRRKWTGGNVLCQIQQVAVVWLQLASMGLVTTLCIERWFSLREAMFCKMSAGSRSRRGRVAVAVVYVLSLVVSSLPAFGLAPDAFSASGKLCEAWITRHPDHTKQRVFHVSFLAVGFGNLLVSMVVNAAVSGVLWRFQKKYGNQCANRMSTAAMQIDSRTVVEFTLMIIMMTVIFYMAWLPVLVSTRVP